MASAAPAPPRRRLALALCGLAARPASSGLVEVGTGYCRTGSGSGTSGDHPWDPKTECLELQPCKDLCEAKEGCAGIAWTAMSEEVTKCKTLQLPRCNLYLGDAPVEKTTSKYQEYTCYRSDSAPGTPLADQATATLTGASAAAPYNCTAGLSNAATGWSKLKKDWCCSHETLGCEAGATGGASAAAEALQVSAFVNASQVPSNASCDSVCTFGDSDGTCQARIQWSADNTFRDEQSPCSKAYAQVRQDCPVCAACSYVFSGCSTAPFPGTPDEGDDEDKQGEDAGEGNAEAATTTQESTATADKTVLPGTALGAKSSSTRSSNLTANEDETDPTDPCSSVCTYEGESHSCEERVQWLAGEGGAGCSGAFEQVQADCPVCEACTADGMKCEDDDDDAEGDDDAAGDSGAGANGSLSVAGGAGAGTTTTKDPVATAFEKLGINTAGHDLTELAKASGPSSAPSSNASSAASSSAGSTPSSAAAPAGGPCVVTESGDPCVFPFTYAGIIYMTCTDVENTQKWCAVAVDSRGELDSKDGSWGQCATSCDALEKAEPANASGPVPASQDNVTACVTVGSAGAGAGLPCVLPFSYEGQTFQACTYAGHAQKWCATQVDSAGKVVKDQWGDCSAACLAAEETLLRRAVFDPFGAQEKYAVGPVSGWWAAGRAATPAALAAALAAAALAASALRRRRAGTPDGPSGAAEGLGLLGHQSEGLCAAAAP
ncbi:unnamed protein product [Prorocentrum cordatum]|uniref:Fibronectin type-II domain-containing protein n=1 Tax=Prorocentrum cordatum TaxID=2364126 RepID=A0ABN9TR08_9DINO|nr:unnamed protein product [Polarella glacialis]